MFGVSGAMKTTAREFLLVCILTSATPGLYAQSTSSGGLGGIVVDPSLAVVSDATVEIRDEAKGTVQSTRTDREGSYRFFFLAPGKYTVAVTHVGFRKERRLVDVLLGSPVSVNFTLTIAEASSSITVTDEVPLLQAENGDVSSTMNEIQVSEVPNPGNDLTYIVQTAPGVIMDTDSPYGGNFSMLGMPGSSYRYTTDGVSDTFNGNNAAVTNAFGLLTGQNQIQEATVVSNGYSGQFGGAAGGNVNYITKSGGNQFHGNAQYYWNGRVLNANDWFGNTFGIPRPFDNAHQWAASFGGPIQKDKVSSSWTTKACGCSFLHRSLSSHRLQSSNLRPCRTSTRSSGRRHRLTISIQRSSTSSIMLRAQAPHKKEFQETCSVAAARASMY